MTLSEKIQLCRKKKGMSQEDLANLLDVSRQAVQKWESGASVPELDKIISMSNIFSVSLDWLIKDINEGKQNNEQSNVTMVLDFSEIRRLKRNEVSSLWREFKKLKYNPKDKRKAKNEASNVKASLLNMLNEDDMNSSIAQYRAFLSSFPLDENYYKKRKKIFIKSLIISASLVVLVGVSVASGFGISVAVKYSRANFFMESGDYKSALNKYIELGDDKKANVCYGLLDLESSKKEKDERLIISGIKKIIGGGESVDVKYYSKAKKVQKLNASDDVEYSELISTESFTLHTPSQINGYTFSNWKTNNFFYKNNQTNLFLDSIWNAVSFSITYELNGGTNDNRNPISYTLDSNELLLYSPSKTGYSFMGWHLNADFSDVAIDKVPIDLCKNLVFYAEWKPIIYSIGYSLNGGTNDSRNPISYTIEDSFVFYEPSKTGYSFQGWYDEGNNKVSQITIGTTGDLLLKAVWQPIVYAIMLSNPSSQTHFYVTYDINGGSGFDSPFIAEAHLDQVIEKPDDPTKDKAIFRGWFEDLACTKHFDFSKKITNNTTLYAGWYDLPSDQFDQSAKTVYMSEASTAIMITKAKDYYYCYFTVPKTSTYHLTTYVSSYPSPLISYGIQSLFSETVNYSGTYSNDGSIPMDIRYYDINCVGGDVIRFSFYKPSGSTNIWTIVRIDPLEIVNETTLSIDATGVPVNVEYDSNYDLGTINYPGYTFYGWYTGPDGSGIQLTGINGKSLSPWKFTEVSYVYAYLTKDS